jgi:hypothetical protein
MKLLRPLLPLFLIGLGLLVTSAIKRKNVITSANDPDGPDKNPVDSIDPQNSAGYRNERRNNYSLIPDPQIPQSPEANYQTYQRRQERRDRWKLGVEIATFFVVLGYTVVAYRQWSVMITTNQISERPWVSVGLIHILNKPVENQPLKILLEILNVGKSPGINLTRHLVFKFWISDKNDRSIPLAQEETISICNKPKPKWRDDSRGSIIMPGTDFVKVEMESPVLHKDIIDVMFRGKKDVPGEILNTIPHGVIPKDSRNWNLSLNLVGCINYFDQFRNSHRTSFCYFYSLPRDFLLIGSFITCSTGNFAD